MPAIGIERVAGAKMNDFVVAVGSQHIGQFIQRHNLLAHQNLIWLAMKCNI